MEFSKIQNQNLEALYKNYSKLIPTIGRIVVGESKPYEYLVKSIENKISSINWKPETFVEAKPKKTRQGNGKHTKYSATSRNHAKKRTRGQG